MPKVLKRWWNYIRYNKGAILGNLVKYFVLIAIAYIFVYPLLRVFSTSVKNVFDQLNPLVIWFPEQLYWENYRRAWVALGGTETLWLSFRNIGFIALVQTASSALIGYGMAKFNYWWSKLSFVLMLIVFIIPHDVFLLPLYTFFSRHGLNYTIWPAILLAGLGQGIKGAIYILIFYSFFKLQPKSLDEAAFVDGAGHLKTFFRINIPMAIPAFLVSFIFSFVWNWNDTEINPQFFKGRVTTLQLALKNFGASYNDMFPYSKGESPLEAYNFGIEMAGTILAIVPLILAYLIIQRFIVEGVDQSGITGE